MLSPENVVCFSFLLSSLLVALLFISDGDSCVLTFGVDCLDCSAELLFMKLGTSVKEELNGVDTSVCGGVVLFVSNWE